MDIDLEKLVPWTVDLVPKLFEVCHQQWHGMENDLSVKEFDLVVALAMFMVAVSHSRVAGGNEVLELDLLKQAQREVLPLLRGYGK